MAMCFTERSQSLYKCDLTCDKLALWVGNEFAGLSGLAISAADTELFIPMRGMIQSLNLSVAAAVCLNEISRQRTSVDPDGCRFAPTEAEQKKMVGWQALALTATPAAARANEPCGCPRENRRRGAC